MHTHYRAVCDSHKEACNLIVNKNWNIAFDFYKDHSKEISEFLTKHYGCDLRMIHNDFDLDFLFENNYKIIDHDWN